MLLLEQIRLTLKNKIKYILNNQVTFIYIY